MNGPATHAADAEDDLGPLVNNNESVRSLQQAVQNAPRDLNMLRLAVGNVLRSGAWQDRFDAGRGRRFTYKDRPFAAFITDPLPDGLGTDVPTLRRLLKDYPEELALLDLAVSRGKGGQLDNRNATAPEAETNHDIVTIRPPVSPPAKGGNSAEYAHRKLARDRPDLFARVTKGELTPHRAMVEAGFRKVPTPLETIIRLLPKLNDAERLQVAMRLHQLIDPASAPVPHGPKEGA